MYYFVNKKNTVSFAHVPCNFISLYLIVLTFALRLKSPNYKSHGNISAFCDQWKTTQDWNIFHEKLSDFVLFQWFVFTLVINLRNFDFENNWNILIWFDKSQVWISPVEKCLFLFHFHFLGSFMSRKKMSDFVSFSFLGWF